MSHRYQAPEHVSEVFTASGPKRANKDGIISLGDDASAADHANLRAAGCRLIGGDLPAKPKAAPKSSSGSGKKKGGAAKPSKPAGPAEPPAS